MGSLPSAALVTLQLIVNHAMKKNTHIQKAIGTARFLVEHFDKSEVASNSLWDSQKTASFKISVRWNSTYYMIWRLLEQRWPVTACLSDSGVINRSKHYLDLNPEQWSLLEELERALKPFECAAVYLSGESYVTLSSLATLIKGLLKSALTTSSFENPHILAFQKAAENEITESGKMSLNSLKTPQIPA